MNLANVIGSKTSEPQRCGEFQDSIKSLESIDDDESGNSRALNSSEKSAIGLSLEQRIIAGGASWFCLVRRQRQQDPVSEVVLPFVTIIVYLINRQGKIAPVVDVTCVFNEDDDAM